MIKSSEGRDGGRERKTWVLTLLWFALWWEMQELRLEDKRSKFSADVTPLHNGKIHPESGPCCQYGWWWWWCCCCCYCWYFGVRVSRRKVFCGRTVLLLSFVSFAFVKHRCTLLCFNLSQPVNNNFSQHSTTTKHSEKFKLLQEQNSGRYYTYRNKQENSFWF